MKNEKESKKIKYYLALRFAGLPKIEHRKSKFFTKKVEHKGNPMRSHEGKFRPELSLDVKSTSVEP